MEGTAKATAQMCSSKVEAKRDAKQALLQLCGREGVQPKTISYEQWEQQVGPNKWYYCTASAEVF